MSVVGICRCKDEQDIIAATVIHMHGQVDQVIVEDNGSTDGTAEILTGLDVDLLHDPTVGYYQSAAMTRLAAYAAQKYDATFVVPFDADELWYSPFGRIADVLDARPDAGIFTAELFDHLSTDVDGDDPNPLVRLGWRRRAATPLPKVAALARPHVTIMQGNHDAEYGQRISGQLIVRHFPYRSPEQFVTKVRNGAAAYAATDLPEHVGKHWRDYGRLLDGGGPEALRNVYRTWFHSASPRTDGSLILDPCAT